MQSRPTRFSTLVEQHMGLLLVRPPEHWKEPAGMASAELAKRAARNIFMLAVLCWAGC